MDYFDYKTGSQIEELPESWEFDVEEFLERSQKEEQQRLEDELEWIEQQLEKRDRIHEETVDQLETKLDWYIGRLKQMYKRSEGKHGERDKVKSRIVDIYRELREEKRIQWRDRQELEEEKREILREIDELELDVFFEYLL